MVKVCGRHVFSGLDPLVRQTVSVAAYCLLVLMRSLFSLFFFFRDVEHRYSR